MSTPLQFAKDNCSNYQATGSCLGIGIRDDLSLYNFGKKARCVLASNQSCRFFEECVLPTLYDTAFAMGAAKERERQEALKLYKRQNPTLGSIALTAGRLCPLCQKRELESRKRLCYVCRNEKRKARRHKG